MIYAVIALFAVIYIETHGIGAAAMNVPGKFALMFLSGLVTLIPVALFSTAATRVSLLFIGLAQYISPTITLLLGIFLFREPIDRIQIAAFIIIWMGLCFFTYGEIKSSADRKEP